MKTLPAAIALILLPALAFAWTEDFNACPLGSLIGGCPGWEAWDLNPAADALVVAAPSRSGHSVEILPTSDVVNDMNGPYAGGVWRFDGWNYIPGNAAGEQYLIMLNQYTHVTGPNNWSVQVLFDANANMVYDISASGPSLPMVRDRWIYCCLEIDLDNDIQTFYYNGAVLYSDSWTNHVSAGGTLTIAVVDLFSNNGASIYWDEFMLEPQMTCGATPVQPASWGQIKSTFR